jgi:hypothetical protein
MSLPRNRTARNTEFDDRLKREKRGIPEAVGSLATNFTNYTKTTKPKNLSAESQRAQRKKGEDFSANSAVVRKIEI